RDVADDDREVDSAAADRQPDLRDGVASAAGAEDVDGVVGARTIVLGDEHVVAEVPQLALDLGADELRGLRIAVVDVAVGRREQRDTDRACGGVDCRCGRHSEEGDSENDASHTGHLRIASVIRKLLVLIAAAVVIVIAWEWFTFPNVSELATQPPTTT